MKKYSSRLFYVIIISGFLLTLYWVAGSNWSSRAVAMHNGGYGTFDMKNYDVHTVEHILAVMDADGYKVSYRYYIGDYLFVVFFGLIQCMISRIIYNPLRTEIKIERMLSILSILVPILRGVTDLIENTMLVTTLLRYPNINPNIIYVASMATKLKLSCIKIWGILIILGLSMGMISKCKNMLCKNI
jgi:uncharacterized secreted protein with C-terminal beta-propeller domain